MITVRTKICPELANAASPVESAACGGLGLGFATETHLA